MSDRTTTTIDDLKRMLTRALEREGARAPLVLTGDEGDAVRLALQSGQERAAAHLLHIVGSRAERPGHGLPYNSGPEEEKAIARLQRMEAGALAAGLPSASGKMMKFDLGQRRLNVLILLKNEDGSWRVQPADAGSRGQAQPGLADLSVAVTDTTRRRWRAQGLSDNGQPPDPGIGWSAPPPRPPRGGWSIGTPPGQGG